MDGRRRFDGVPSDATGVQRRNVLLACLLLAALSAFATSVFADYDAFDRSVGLLLGGVLLVLAAGIAATARPPKSVKITAIVVAAAYLPAKIGHVLFAYAGTPRLDREMAELAPWGPVVLIVAWVLFEPGPLLSIMVGAYYAVVLAVAGALGAARGARELLQSLDTMAPFVLASLAATIFLAVLTQMRHQYAESQAARRVMARIASTDSLTGLPNRRQCMAELTREIAVAARSGKPLGIILFDLDRFKAINDNYGHQAGDEALIAAAEHVRGRLRATDIVGRWGGEEFLILAPGDNLGNATHLAEEMCASFRERFTADDRIRLTASFGVTAFQDGDTVDTLISRADAALYLAKGQGRNRTAVMASRAHVPQAAAHRYEDTYLPRGRGT